MKKILIMLMLLLAFSCKQKKVDEFGTIQKEGTAVVEEKPKEETKESQFKEGKIVYSLLVGKYSTSSAGYGEIKQEGNKLYLRLGEVSQADFEKAFEKDTSLTYRKTSPLAGDLKVDVYKNWIELNPIMIGEKEYLKLGAMDIFLYQNDETSFSLYTYVENNFTELPDTFWKADIKDYPKMNEIEYNFINDITKLQLFQ